MNQRHAIDAAAFYRALITALVDPDEPRTCNYALLDLVDQVCMKKTAAGVRVVSGGRVDILVESTEPPGFVRFMDLKLFLEDLLGCRVDLVTPKAFKPRLRSRVEKEAIHVPRF